MTEYKAEVINYKCTAVAIMWLNDVNAHGGTDKMF